MALKRRHSLFVGRKGILLTLFTIVLFVLMLSELVTYVVLNINYSNLETQVSSATGTSSIVQNVNASLATFLHSSLSGALAGLTYYESTPSVRKDSFINNTAAALATVMNTGSYNSYSLSSYEGTTLSQYIAMLVKQAAGQGASVSITNGTLSVFQSGAFTIGASYTALLTINQSNTVSSYFIDAQANVSTGFGQYLLAAEQGSYSMLVPGTTSPNATVVGNIYAKAGSTSPYMFAYGTVVYYPGKPNCSSIASGYKNNNFILATPNATNIGQNVCGMAGLVTDTINASTPLVPYLLYANSSIMSYLQGSPSLLLAGQRLALLNTTPLQQAVQSGYAYASPYMPSYLQRSQNDLFGSSSNGFYTFSTLNTKAAQFNGASSYIEAPSNIPANSPFTISAWVFLLQGAGAYPMIVDEQSGQTLFFGVNIGQGYNGLNVWLGSGIQTFNSNPFAKDAWQYVTLTYNGSVAKVYDDGVFLSNTVSTASVGFNGIYIGNGTRGSNSFWDGSIADVQVYNAALQPAQIAQLYHEGISGTPASNSVLTGWWPLGGNATDFSGQSNNGVATNVIYAAPGGYTFDSLSSHVPGIPTSKAAQFNGASSISTPLPSNGVTGTTISAWFSTPIETTGQVIALLGSNGGTNGYGIYTGGTNTGCPAGQFAILESGVRWICTLYPFSTNKLYNTVLVSTASGTSNVIYTLYANGNVAYTSPPESLPVTPTGNLLMGNDTAGRTYNGTLADVQVYNTGLSVAQVSQLYQDGINGGPISNAGLVGWWPLSGNANDYSGKGNNGIPTNVIYSPLPNSPTANLVEGVLNCGSLNQCSNTTLQHLYLNPLPLEHAGRGFMNETTALDMIGAALPDAMSFNGVSDYVGASGNPISGSGAFTLSAWVYAQSMSNYGGAFAIGSPSSGESAYIGYVTTAQTGTSNSIGGGLYGTNLGSGITSGGWHFVTLTFGGGTAGSLIVYVDGVQKVSTTATPAITGSSMLIGAIQTNGYFFNGSVADVQLYSSALSSAQVQQLYLNNSVQGVTPVDYWPLGAGMNGLLNETSDIVHGNTGYLYGNGAACTNSQVVNGQCGPSYTPP